MPRARQPGDVELDLGRYELRREGRRIPLEKKPMDLLIFLVSRREQLVSREDIVKKLWRSDLFIDSERNLNNIIRKIRTALGDNPERPRFLETVIGKGYRFIGPVRLIDARFPQSDLHHDSLRGERHEDRSDWSERSALAVLPLVLVGKAVDDQGICLGFADALVSQLGNLKGIDVLPTSAVMNLPQGMTASELAVRLGVRFVVHGAIQTTKGQWRFSLEMLDVHAKRTCFTRNCDFDADHLSVLERDIAAQIANTLNRPLAPAPRDQRPRYSRDPMSYAEFMRGYALSGSGDPNLVEKSSHHLTNAVTRDPNFALGHAMLSFVCAVRHFESDPSSAWLEKAEFHCRKALEIDPDLPEGLVSRAFLLWGPSKNFQHIEAIADLKRALSLQANLPHAYNRLGTVLSHIGLLDHATEMYERGRPFHPKKAVSPSSAQAYVWSLQLEKARAITEQWLAESPGHKYPLHFALQIAMLSADWDEAARLIDEARKVAPDEPLLITMQGMLHAHLGNADAAQECVMRACAIPRSFGHAHHSYYQIACIHSMIGRRDTAFAWLERTVNTGFACWPYFLKDPALQNLRGLPEFELLVSSLQAKYPDHLGLL
jgi:DNA-binding winged helix-turn-helix (wHTH) protein